MKRLLTSGGRASVLTTLGIVVVSALAGMLVGWSAPGVNRYTRDWLTQMRGVLPAPDDIAIIAIDEKSIRRFGRFPWPRALMARAIRSVAAAQAKAISLDVLYTDASMPDADRSLAAAIAEAGNVVVAAQLAEAASSRAEASWLLPIAEIASAAAAVGHVNVHAEAEAVAREMPVRASDDEGRVLLAMPVQAIRVAERIPETEIVDRSGAVVVGSHVIRVDAAPRLPLVESAHARVLRAGRMPIDYIGPTGSFAANSFSIADVLDGSVPSARFRDRYVLIGATAASLGDRFAGPFTHFADVQGGQHGSLMPGVEVLANALNTILRERYYAEVPEWLAFLWAAAIAALTIGVLGAAQGGRESLKQLGVLFSVATAVVMVSYLSFRYALVFPPVAEQFVSFASAGMLGLLRRSIVTSAQLDQAIGDMAQASGHLSPAAPSGGAAETMARLLGARAVAILRCVGRGRFRLSAVWGLPAAPALESRPWVAFSFENATVSQYFVADAALRVRIVPCGPHRIAIAYEDHFDAPEDLVQAALSIAEKHLEQFGGHSAAAPIVSPERVVARARALSGLNARMIERSHFVDLAMRSVGDGLLITGPDGRITFANPGAAECFRCSETALIGSSLPDRLAEHDPSMSSPETFRRLLLDKAPIEREITVGLSRQRRYTVRLAPVCPEHDPAAPALGIVASLSDITRQQELQQTKNDVISLVSHEMRTPLTAIQGMSELLASYDVAPERRREMNLAINDEVKRLTRMITQYLDITRLESGATVVRRTPVRLDALIDRTILLLEPIAAERGIRITRHFPPDLPGVVADPDLLARAIENLVSNAIKYSPPRTTVSVSVEVSDREMAIAVADEGFGIPAEDTQRVFEKFYRVARAQDADIPGTGLGLSLVKEIAELHGGSISVRSELHAGSTFTLRIPGVSTAAVSNFVKS